MQIFGGELNPTAAENYYTILVFWNYVFMWFCTIIYTQYEISHLVLEVNIKVSV